VSGSPGQARGPAVDCAAPAGSGGGGCPLGSSMRWAGGQPTVRARGQPPPALMHRPMVSPAQQRQIRQIGGAAVQPVPEMVGLAPGQGPGAAGEHTAAVAHRRGDTLGGLHDPGGAADLQRLGGAPPRTGGSIAAVARSRPPCPWVRLGSRVAGWSWAWGPGWSVRWRVTSTLVTAPSQASRRHASGSSGPAPPISPPRRGGQPGCPGPRTRTQAPPPPHLGTTFPHRAGSSQRARWSRPTPVPGECMGPDGPDPPCHPTAPDPPAPGPPCRIPVGGPPDPTRRQPSIPFDPAA
jgi:hypothetical protein